jgi:hypothetical protein
MLVCLKDWIDTEVRDQDHFNLYDISEYDMSILFFMTRIILFFSPHLK